MSPRSRGRGPKKRPKQRGSGRRGDAFAGLLRDLGRDLAEETTALGAELVVSTLIGSWWGGGELGADAEVTMGEELVRYAAGRRQSPSALAVLRVFAELGTPAQRELAAHGAADLAAAGVADPPWAGDIGAGRVAGCWSYGDVYGDQTSVLVSIENGAASHGVVVLVDHTFGGYAKDAFVVDDGELWRREVTQAFAGDDTVWLREIDAARAAALAVPAMDATHPDSLLTPDTMLPDTRALVLARLRLLPPTSADPAAPATPAETESESTLVREFVAAHPDLGEGVPVEWWARVLAAAMGEIDDRPGRVSPMKLEMLVGEKLPDVLDEDAPQWETLPVVLRAWVVWAADRQGLPEAAREELVELVEGLSDESGEEWEVFLDAITGDIPESASDDEFGETLARRAFAVGSPRAHDISEDAPFDPSDPEERAQAILDEHPEYADALETDDLVDGVNPRLHVTMHEIVTNQLWDDDPPEMWAAAQRMLESGMERHDVLHALGEVVSKHIWTAMTQDRPHDPAAYAADLAALGP